MKVYVLSRHCYEEPSEIESVFANESAALAALSEKNQTPNGKSGWFMYDVGVFEVVE